MSALAGLADSFNAVKGFARLAVAAADEQAGVEARLSTYYNKKAGWNPLNWLKRQWEQLITIPDLQDRLALTIQTREDASRSLAGATELPLLGRFNTLSGADNRPYIDALRRRSLLAAELENEGTFLKHTNTVLENIAQTRQLCADARLMEMSDAISNNPGVAYLSHLETSKSLTALGQTKVILEKYRAYARSCGVEVDANISARRIDDLNKDNHFDLAVDFISELGGAFSSLSNAEKLTKAIEKLDQAAQQVGAVRDRTHMAAALTAYAFLDAERDVMQIRRDMADKMQDPVARDLLKQRSGALSYLTDRMQGSDRSPAAVLGSGLMEAVHLWRRTPGA